MNTNQLMRILNNIVHDSFFFDVIGSDRLYEVYHRLKDTPLALVINTDPEDKPGSHWVALFRCKFGRVEFFDSYGDPLSKLSKNFNFLKSLNPVENCKSVQSLQTNTCGKFCIFFLWKRLNGCSYSSIINTFGCSKNRNEMIVRRFYYYLVRGRYIEPFSLRKTQCCNLRVTNWLQNRQL